jgi:hypothetical protein
VNWSTLVLDPLLTEHIRHSIWSEREFGSTAVMVGSVHLVLPPVLLRSLFMACRPRGLYQVLGEDRYGRG